MSLRKFGIFKNMPLHCTVDVEDHENDQVQDQVLVRVHVHIFGKQWKEIYFTDELFVQSSQHNDIFSQYSALDAIAVVCVFIDQLIICLPEVGTR
jgi:hypothetical protein